MPYRIDIRCPPHDALDILVELGALDIEAIGGGLAAILPDSVTRDMAAAALGVDGVAVSPAVARDDGSVWLLSPRTVRAGGIVIAPPGAAAPAGAVRLVDSAAFGSGHHPTTVLCIEALEEAVALEHPASVLDVGTGSGILALTALALGVPEATGLDIDPGALQAAAENARLNRLADRLRLVEGGPESVDGTWPLVVANVLAAPLIGMAPALVRRLGSRGRIVLSGIPRSLEAEVRRAYEHCGVLHTGTNERGGWMVLTGRASW